MLDIVTTNAALGAAVIYYLFDSKTRIAVF